MMELTILLILIEQRLKRMNPDSIIDRTHDPLDVRFNFLYREELDNVQHFIVVAIDEKNFFSCLSFSRGQPEQQTLEIIGEIPTAIMDSLKK